MKKTLLYPILCCVLFLFAMVLLTACNPLDGQNITFDTNSPLESDTESTTDCIHSWTPATCTEPSICSYCSQTNGSVLDHDWKDATCAEPRTCSRCSQTSGSALGHDWKDPTCTEPRICSRCSQTSWSALGHNWEDATCTAPKTCSVCDKTEGKALGHSYTSQISVEATCSTDGKKTFSCRRCKDRYVEAYQMPAHSADELFEALKVSVGEIVTYDKSGDGLSLGTCFVYGSGGKIITNYHVIDGAYSAEITIQEKTYTVTQVLAYDKTIDIAVLKINASGLKAVQLCKKEHKVGTAVYALGSSQGLTETFSQGMLTSNRELDNILYVQHDAAISSGNSGGPLINQYGEVIGINTWTVRDSQNLNFAISISELDNLTYDNPMTMAEYHARECDPLTKLKNYAIANGTYSSSDNTYTVTLGYDYSSDYSTKYTRKLEYNTTDNKIDLLLYSESSTSVYLFGIAIDEIDSSYIWACANDDSYSMAGLIYPGTFSSSTLLGYASTNVPSYLRSTFRELSTSYANLLLIYLKRDLQPTGVTLEDLGFSNW